MDRELKVKSIKKPIGNLYKKMRKYVWGGAVKKLKILKKLRRDIFGKKLNFFFPLCCSNNVSVDSFYNLLSMYYPCLAGRPSLFFLIKYFIN